MRTIKFSNIYHGSMGERGTPMELAEHELWITPYGIIPPLHVLNALFARGRVDDGYTWAPFEIDSEEWESIVAAFEAKGCRTMDTPEWVRTPSDWRAWRWEVTHGIPAMDHLRYNARDEWLAEQIREALAAGDEERMLLLHLERVEGEDTLEELDMMAAAFGGTRVGSAVFYVPEEEAEEA